jgi:hypothetical protein
VGIVGCAVGDAVGDAAAELVSAGDVEGELVSTGDPEGELVSIGDAEATADSVAAGDEVSDARWFDLEHPLKTRTAAKAMKAIDCTRIRALYDRTKGPAFEEGLKDA